MSFLKQIASIDFAKYRTNTILNHFDPIFLFSDRKADAAGLTLSIVSFEKVWGVCFLTQ